MKGLVRKLKASANNDALDFIYNTVLLSAISQDSPADADRMLILRTSGTINVSVDRTKGAFAYSTAALSTDPMYSLDITSSDGQVVLYFKNANYDIFIKGKYSVLWCQNSSSTTKPIVNVNIGQLDYTTDMVRCRLIRGAIKGDISYLKNCTSLRYLELQYSTNVKGDVSSIGKLNNLIEADLSYTGIGGDISGIKGLPNLTKFSFAHTNISGALEDFVDGNARDSVAEADAISMYGLFSQVTFGGNTFYQDGAFVFWESAQKIAVLTGSSDKSQCNIVVALGYTSEDPEVEIWKTDKRVIDAVTKQEL